MKSAIYRVETRKIQNKHKEKRVVQLVLTAIPTKPGKVDYDFRHCRLLEALAAAFSNPDGFSRLAVVDYAVEVKRQY